jgi:DNA-binding response OmpR family regulator
MKVLIVDAEQELSEILTNIVKDEFKSDDIISYTNLVKAVSELKTHGADFVVVSHELFEEHPPEIFKYLTKKTNLILMSSDVMIDIESYREKGVHGVLVRPVDEELLFRMLKRE